MPTFCWPSPVVSARHAVDAVALATTGRLQARQSSEPDVLAATRRDAIVYGEVDREGNGSGLQSVCDSFHKIEESITLTSGLLRQGLVLHGPPPQYPPLDHPLSLDGMPHRQTSVLSTAFFRPGLVTHEEATYPAPAFACAHCSPLLGVVNGSCIW